MRNKDYEDVLDAMNLIINKLRLGNSFMNSYEKYGEVSFKFRAEKFYEEAREESKNCGFKFDKLIENLSKN